MKPAFFFLLTITLLFSCTGKKEEVVDFDQLGPGSEKYTDAAPDSTVQQLTVVSERPETSVLLAVADTLLPGANWLKWDSVLFPDRFGAKSVEKWIVTGPKDSLVLLRYEFKDSLRTKNAFFNWMDCFGARCTSYVIGDNVRLSKRNGLLLVGEKQLLFIEGNRPLKEIEIRASLEKDPEKENWLYVVTIPRKGKTVWKRIDKGIEKPIKKVYENS